MSGAADLAAARGDTDLVRLDRYLQDAVERVRGQIGVGKTELAGERGVPGMIEADPGQRVRADDIDARQKIILSRPRRPTRRAKEFFFDVGCCRYH